MGESTKTTTQIIKFVNMLQAEKFINSLNWLTEEHAVRRRGDVGGDVKRGPETEITLCFSSSSSSSPHPASESLRLSARRPLWSCPPFEERLKRNSLMFGFHSVTPFDSRRSAANMQTLRHTPIDLAGAPLREWPSWRPADQCVCVSVCAHACVRAVEGFAWRGLGERSIKGTAWCTK